MQYFVKLVIGGQYLLFGKIFQRGVEHAVLEKEFEYIKGLFDTRNVEQGDKIARLKVPLFATRVVEPTVEEKILAEVKDTPDTLKPKRKD